MGRARVTVGPSMPGLAWRVFWAACLVGAQVQATPAEEAASQALLAAQQAQAFAVDAPERAEASRIAALWAVAAEVEFLAEQDADEAVWPRIAQAIEAASAVVGPRRSIDGVPYVPQANDSLCATACAQMALRYLGFDVSERDVLRLLDEDAASTGVHVSRMQDIADFYGVHALSGEGSEALIRCAIAVGYPVLIYQYASLTDTTHHMRVIVGFDDIAQVYYSLDPSRDFGPNLPIGYSQFARLWSLPWREDGRSQWLCIMYRRPEDQPS